MRAEIENVEFESLLFLQHLQFPLFVRNPRQKKTAVFEALEAVFNFSFIQTAKPEEKKNLSGEGENGTFVKFKADCWERISGEMGRISRKQ